MKKCVQGIIIPVLLLLLWYAVTRMQVFNEYLLPSPGTVWDALTELAASGELAKHLSISLRRVFLGFLLSACTAIPLYRHPPGYRVRAQPVFLHLLLVSAGILTACAASGRHSFNHFVGGY